MTELLHTPLFGLLLTLASYRAATWLYGKAHSLPVFHPFLVASIPVVVVGLGRAGELVRAGKLCVRAW